MKKDINRVEKVVADMAYRTSVRNVNKVCIWFFNQPKLPEKLKKLKNTNVK